MLGVRLENIAIRSPEHVNLVGLFPPITSMRLNCFRKNLTTLCSDCSQSGLSSVVEAAAFMASMLAFSINYVIRTPDSIKDRFTFLETRSLHFCLPDLRHPRHVSRPIGLRADDPRISFRVQNVNLFRSDVSSAMLLVHRESNDLKNGHPLACMARRDPQPQRKSTPFNERFLMHLTR